MSKCHIVGNLMHWLKYKSSVMGVRVILVRNNKQVVMSIDFLSFFYLLTVIMTSILVLGKSIKV